MIEDISLIDSQTNDSVNLTDNVKSLISHTSERLTVFLREIMSDDVNVKYSINFDFKRQICRKTDVEKRNDLSDILYTLINSECCLRQSIMKHYNQKLMKHNIEICCFFCNFKLLHNLLISVLASVTQTKQCKEIVEKTKKWLISWTESQYLNVTWTSNYLCLTINEELTEICFKTAVSSVKNIVLHLSISHIIDSLEKNINIFVIFLMKTIYYHDQTELAQQQILRTRNTKSITLSTCQHCTQDSSQSDTEHSLLISKYISENERLMFSSYDFSSSVSQQSSWSSLTSVSSNVCLRALSSSKR